MQNSAQLTPTAKVVVQEFFLPWVRSALYACMLPVCLCARQAVYVKCMVLHTPRALTLLIRILPLQYNMLDNGTSSYPYIMGASPNAMIQTSASQ